MFGQGCLEPRQILTTLNQTVGDKLLTPPPNQHKAAFTIPTSAGTDFLRIDHIQLAAPTGSEEKAREFFGTVLGMKEILKPENLRRRGGVWFEVGSNQLHIGMEKSKSFHPNKKAHPAFEVRNYHKLLNLLVSEGFPVETGEPLEDANRFYAEDPFGNRLEFIQRKRTSEFSVRALLRRRRNVYGFGSKPVPLDLLSRILEDSTHVPSAGFSRDFDLIAISKKETIRKIARAVNEEEYEKEGIALPNFVSNASVVVVPCGNKARFERKYGKPAERHSRLPWWIVDASFSSLALILLANECGVSASFIGAVNEAKLAQALHLPKGGSVVPLAVIPLGYKDLRENSLWVGRRSRVRRSVRTPKELIHWERW